MDFAQIGAFIHQVDFLIKENKLNNKPQRLILLAPPILTVNKYLAKIFKRTNSFRKLFSISNIYPLMHYNLTSIHPNSETINKNNTYNLVHKKYRLKTGKY